MSIGIGGFDWDEGNRAKCQKHGVSITEIEALFRSDPFVAPAWKHAKKEDRRIAVGKTASGRGIFVAFTMRTKGQTRLLRPISARYMHTKEFAAYEKERTKSENR
jgi:uncharacterized DUF497 family protein